MASLSHPPPEKGPQITTSIYTSMPPNVATHFTSSSGQTYQYTFVQLPTAHSGGKDKTLRSYSRFINHVVYKLVPVITVMISVCTLLGLYYVALTAAPPPSYFSRSSATPSQLSLPKKSPSQTDAAAMDYQHAITTEWIAAADTAVAKTSLSKSKARKEVKKKMVTVKASRFAANDKKGIRNLEFKITNGSAHRLERVMLQVDFFSASGRLMHTEQYSVNKVPPQGAKTVKVPPGTKGRKIAYRIIEVKSHSYTTVLQHI